MTHGRGITRERQVRKQLTDDGWLAFRAPASLGVADIVALKAGQSPLLCEVKSTAKGPYEHFGPAARAALVEAAELAGANAYLVHWPSRGKANWIPSQNFPTASTESTGR